MAENIIIIPEGKVRDYIDGTIRNETPEEYVRQTVEKRLVIEHKYTKRQIGIEYTVKMGVPENVRVVLRQRPAEGHADSRPRRALRGEGHRGA